MKLYDYLVSFDTYQSRICRHIEIGVVAPNAKSARAFAENLWYERHDPHMFHIEVHRHKATPCSFRVINYYSY